MQFCCKDLAERAIAYGIPGIIVDGTDPCQVYDATHEACERARRGEGSTLIEAKMMRMKGHAIHDAAQYVPRALLEYWQRRDPITRFEHYIVEEKKWLTRKAHDHFIADVESQLERERAAAEGSSMPTAQEDAQHQGVYCDSNCHDVKPKYGPVKFGVTPSNKATTTKDSEAAVHLR
jgi:TPP-dependent pyruvate/acetoin dehydrogenase alpha subunit